MKGTDNRTKLCQLDKLIIKAKQNLSPVAAQVKLSITQTDKHEQSELERKAREEILKDTALGVRRYEKIGPQGWYVLFENSCQAIISILFRYLNIVFKSSSIDSLKS